MKLFPELGKVLDSGWDDHIVVWPNHTWHGQWDFIESLLVLPLAAPWCICHHQLLDISVCVYMCVYICMFKNKPQAINSLSCSSAWIESRLVFPSLHVEVYVILEAAEMWKNECLLRLACQVTKVKYIEEKLKSRFWKTFKDCSFIFLY